MAWMEAKGAVGELKLYAIRYGEHFKYGTWGTVFQNAENPNETIEDFAFLYYLAELDGEYLLFDTGFNDEKLAADMGVKLLGIEKEIEQVFGGVPKIKTIVLTHSHWDHIDNIVLYPESEIIMAMTAYEIVMESGTEAVKARLEKGKIRLVDKECLIADKFRFRVVGGHTHDSSVVYFEEQGKIYCITGDECYQCDNIRKNTPIGISINADNNRQFIFEAHEKGWIPLPFHDAAVFSDYEVLSENIVRII